MALRATLLALIASCDAYSLLGLTQGARAARGVVVMSSDDWKYGTGSTELKPAQGGTEPLGSGVNVAAKAQQSGPNDFRFGTGSLTPVPLGGTGVPSEAPRADAATTKQDSPKPAATKAASSPQAGDMVATAAKTQDASAPSPAWDFRHGVGSTDPVPLGGTGLPTDGVPTPQSWSNPTDEFRYGRGSVTPVPLGGTGLASDSAGRTKAPQEALTGRDDFAHGSGSTVPKPLGGP